MGFIVSRDVQSAVRNLLRVIRKSEYLDGLLCSPVTIGWLRMHRAAHRELPRTYSVSRDTLDSMRDVNHIHEGTSKNFPHFEY